MQSVKEAGRTPERAGSTGIALTICAAFKKAAELERAMKASPLEPGGAEFWASANRRKVGPKRRGSIGFRRPEARSKPGGSVGALAAVQAPAVFEAES